MKRRGRAGAPLPHVEPRRRRGQGGPELAACGAPRPAARTARSIHRRWHRSSAVVVLDRERVGAASVGAPWGGPPQWDALRDGGAAAEVRDVEHVDAPGDDDLEDRLTEQLAGPLDRSGADAGDLAELVALDPTPHQRLDVDAQQCEDARIRAGRLLVPRS